MPQQVIRVVPPGGFMGFAQMAPASQRSLIGSSGTPGRTGTKRRRTKRKANKARKRSGRVSKKARLVKGSAAAKAYMAKIRRKRKK